MESDVLARLPVVRASRLVTKDNSPASGFFSLANMAGRLVEIINTPEAPAVSAAFCIIHEAVTSGEPVIWINQSNLIFFPPDLRRMNIAPGLLPVVRSQDTRSTLRSLEHLLRSGAYGLVVVNADRTFAVDQGRLGKLARLADMHGTAVLFLLEKEPCAAYSLGSGISLQCSVRLGRSGENGFEIRSVAEKDKCHSPGWTETRMCHGPAGLC